MCIRDRFILYEIITFFQLNRYTQYITYRTILISWQFTSVKQNKIPVISDDTVLFGDIFLDIVSLFPFYCPNINPSSYIENIGLQLYSHGTLTLTQTSNNSDITRESTKGYKSRNQIYFLLLVIQFYNNWIKDSANNIVIYTISKKVYLLIKCFKSPNSNATISLSLIHIWRCRRRG